MKEVAGLLALRPLQLEDEEEALQAHEEFPGDFAFLPQLAESGSFDAWLRRLEQQRLGREFPAGHLPATFLVAEVAGDLVGRATSVTSSTTACCATAATSATGFVHGSRGCGYSTEMLRQSLELLASRGAEHALVTCTDDNLASRRTIERCGGRLEDVLGVADDGSKMRRYWVATGT